jgi:D-alanyl-lipoteichoic acid acyltransferase DltB (MBOAT superfamily)
MPNGNSLDMHSRVLIVRWLLGATVSVLIALCAAEFIGRFIVFNGKPADSNNPQFDTKYRVKYCNFFIDTTNSTLAFLHLHLVYIHPLKLLLPLGISFYTFEAISYLVDVFRGCAAMVRQLFR